MINILTFASAFILPCVILYIVGYGLLSKLNIYDIFIDGAKDGIKIVFNIMPTLVGLLFAVGILRASSAFDLLGQFLEPVLDRLGMIVEVFTLAIVKMFSSSASTGILTDIYKNYGTDSSAGMMASIILSSTETVFYTISVYFLSVKITKTRYTVQGALVATIAGVVASVVITHFLFM